MGAGVSRGELSGQKAGGVSLVRREWVAVGLMACASRLGKRGSFNANRPTQSACKSRRVRGRATCERGGRQHRFEGDIHR